MKFLTVLTAALVSVSLAEPVEAKQMNQKYAKYFLAAMVVKHECGRAVDPDLIIDLLEKATPSESGYPTAEELEETFNVAQDFARDYYRKAVKERDAWPEDICNGAQEMLVEYKAMK